MKRIFSPLKIVAALGAAAALVALATFVLPATPVAASDPYLDRAIPSEGMTNADIEAMNQHEITWMLSQKKVVTASYTIEKDFQSLIKVQNKRHGNTTPLDIALGTYDTGFLVAQSVYTKTAKVIGAQWGFDAQGHVTNRQYALQTVTDARAGLRDVHYRLVLITHNLHRAYSDWHNQIVN
jgi:hypothetical protein